MTTFRWKLRVRSRVTSTARLHRIAQLSLWPTHVDIQFRSNKRARGCPCEGLCVRQLRVRIARNNMGRRRGSMSPPDRFIRLGGSIALQSKRFSSNEPGAYWVVEREATQSGVSLFGVTATPPCKFEIAAPILNTVFVKPQARR